MKCEMEISKLGQRKVNLHKRCTKFPSITEELMRRGYADGDIQKIIGLNTMRVMEENIGK